MSPLLLLLVVSVISLFYQYGKNTANGYDTNLLLISTSIIQMSFFVDIYNCWSVGGLSCRSKAALLKADRGERSELAERV